MENIEEAKLRNIRVGLRAAQSHLLDNYFLYKEFVVKDSSKDPILSDITSAIEYTKRAINRISGIVDQEVFEEK